jgi:hypothetical protein
MKKCGRQKLTYEEVKKTVEENGFVLISAAYLGHNEKLQVKCPEGHKFLITYHSFKQGTRCSECSGKKKKDIEEIRILFEKEGYLLLSAEYKNIKIPLHSKCPKGHDCFINYHSFRRGHRCLECSGKKKKAFEEVKALFEKEGYSLVSDKYKNNREKLHSRCPKGHDYHTTYSSFKYGYRCPCCSNRGTSIPEIELTNILIEQIPHLIKRSFKINIPNKPHVHGFQIDIYDPKTKRGIEYDGQYYHSEEYLIETKTAIGWPLEDAKNYHSLKDSSLMSLHGITLLHIKGEDWELDKQACVQRCLDFLKS